MKRFVIQAAVALMVLSIGFAGFKFLAAMKKPQTKHSRPPAIKTVKVKVALKKTVYPEVKALGQVRSEHPVQVAAEAAGTIMSTRFKFKSGSHFKKGQTLVEIDSRRAELNFKSAVSNLLNALTSVLPEIKADIPTEFPKWNTFFSKTSFEKLPDLPDIKDQKEKLYMSRFNVYNLYFAAKNMQITFEKHFFKASFTGTVTNSNIRPGSTVGMGSPMGTIVRSDKMEIEVPLSAIDADWIDKKAKVTFTIAESGKKHSGKVDRIARAMSGSSQTISAFVAVDRKSALELMDGMYADVLFKGKEMKKAVSLPRKAVIGKDKIHYVKEGRLNTAEVTIPRFGIDKVYITDGIEDGDTLVVEAVQDAIENMQVRTFIKNESGNWDKTWKEEKKAMAKAGQGKGGHH